MLCTVFSVISKFCILSFFDHTIQGIKILAIILQSQKKTIAYNGLQSILQT